MARTPRVKANGKGKGAKLAATSKEVRMRACCRRTGQLPRCSPLRPRAT